VVTLRRPAVVLMTANDAARGKQIFDSGEYAPKPEANGHHGGYQRGDQHGDHHPDDPGPEPLADEGQHTLLADLFTAADLDSMTFAPLVEHVPNLITEGSGYWPVHRRLESLGLPTGWRWRARRAEQRWGPLTLNRAVCCSWH